MPRYLEQTHDNNGQNNSNPQDGSNIISTRLPYFKPSYEKIIHKKIFNSDIVAAIPRGDKRIVWITHHEGAVVCLIITPPEHGMPPRDGYYLCEPTNCCFSPDLAYGMGTMLYGTLFHREAQNNNRDRRNQPQHSTVSPLPQQRFFTIEDIIYYKGESVDHLQWIHKFEYMRECLSRSINQQSYNKSFIIMGVPAMNSTMSELNTDIKNNNVPYNVKYVQYIKLFDRRNKYNWEYTYNHINSHRVSDTTGLQQQQQQRNRGPLPKNTTLQKDKERERIFMVSATDSVDIYHLRDVEHCDKYVIAGIPNVFTSVMMNGIFRNIKENSNIDAIEESDSDDDSDDDNGDNGDDDSGDDDDVKNCAKHYDTKNKYVDLTKNISMVCQYNSKFKKWVPIKIN